MDKFKCKVCLYIHTGETPPEICPKCGAPKEQFEKIPDNISLLIDRASKTNTLLIGSLNLINQLSIIANNGIEDNLDPTCLYIFQRIKEYCKIIEKMIISEIHLHAEKNKWG